ncbi:hypothetical protein [Ochrobactrum sp. Marseille-Q0166]|uniref:hypothetical protein n=1 Tax=Ochrobactrum sp. Marseille-Q0166 TaxID=2761105 RepID=UPI0016552CED|nr:hypothetical protein [Ochrobactrum sp. Marseille-Q0166]MBC8717932.1 hypothetical protein [Ochrobactrum sp. Marseille-Q0166]
MNSILVAKELAEKYEFADREWYYNYKIFPDFCDEKITNKGLNGISRNFSKLTKSWSKERNSEWICRIYLSTKMIMMATLQLQALEYAKVRNLRVVVPYLEYYSILCLLRGIVYTSPHIEWDSGEIIRISHNKAIEFSCNHMAQFNPTHSNGLKNLILDLKANRELISYRSPSSGDFSLIEIPDIVKEAKLLAEACQVNSELLERSVQKNSDTSSFVFLPEFSDQLSSIELEGRSFFDPEDCYRLNYLTRNHPCPSNILHTMTEGHVEDFFGAWWTENDSGVEFDPDTNWQLIFDIP